MSVRDKDTGEEHTPLRQHVVCAPDLLQYLPESHSSFYQDDMSVVSELSLPFSDDPIREMALVNIPRGQSISTLFTFSPANQSVMNALRNESSNIETLVAEPLVSVTPKRRLSRSTSLEELVRELLNDASLRLTPPTSSEEEEEANDDEKKEEEEVKQKEDTDSSEVKKAVHKVESESEYFDTKSGLWKMLGAYNEFLVTPSGFNVFMQATPHWSEKVPPSWDKLEESRQKCEDWLNKWDPPLKK